MNMHRPNIAQTFVNSIHEQFQALQDPFCRIPSNDVANEAIKLYPSAPLTSEDAMQDIQHVVLSRSAQSATGEGAESPSLYVALDDSQTRYYIRNDQLVATTVPLREIGNAGMRQSIEDSLQAHHGHRGRVRVVSPREAANVTEFTANLKSRPKELYSVQQAYEGNTWSNHFLLPEPRPRDEVIAILHEATDALRYAAAIPIKELPEKGLSGVLLGPDDDAATVTEVIFANDPSRRWGLRDAGDSDRYTVRIAELHHWTHAPGGETILDGYLRTIMGRNKDKYLGKLVFSLAETTDMLETGSPLEITAGGYLFSTRPLQKPYGEPAIVVEAAYPEEDEARRDHIVTHLAELAWRLGHQDRWVLEGDKTEVYTSNG